MDVMNSDVVGGSLQISTDVLAKSAKECEKLNPKHDQYYSCPCKCNGVWCFVACNRIKLIQEYYPVTFW